MRATAVLCALGAGLLALSSSLSPAHEGATGVVKERMDDMKTIGRATKRIGDRLNAKRVPGGIAEDADAIRIVAARMPSLFPRGSGGGHSEATAAVWERWPDFVASARLLEQEAEKLAAAARSGSDAALAAHLQSVTRTCTACHDTFRVKQ